MGGDVGWEPRAIAERLVSTTGSWSASGTTSWSRAARSPPYAHYHYIGVLCGAPMLAVYTVFGIAAP